MEENKLAPEIPPTQEERILRLGKNLARGGVLVYEGKDLPPTVGEEHSRRCTESRRRDMFERVALALTSAGVRLTWEDVREHASELLKEADKFAKGE